MKKNIWLKNFLLFFLIMLLHQVLLKNAYAIRYSLIAPSETLTRGQTVTFFINIDTQGETVTNAAIGMTYETQYLEYVNTIAGDAFPNLITTPQEGGKLIFEATSSGFSGSTTFAQVNFKIIAQAPGESELCVLWEVTPTPSSPQPTQPDQPEQPTQPAQPTQPNQPSPTTLPTSGKNKPIFIGLMISSLSLLTASLGLVVAKKTSFKSKSPLKKTASDASKNK